MHIHDYIREGLNFRILNVLKVAVSAHKMDACIRFLGQTPRKVFDFRHCEIIFGAFLVVKSIFK